MQYKKAEKNKAYYVYFKMPNMQIQRRFICIANGDTQKLKRLMRGFYAEFPNLQYVDFRKEALRNL